MGRGRAVPSRRGPSRCRHASGELQEVPSGAADRTDGHHDDAPARRRAGSGARVPDRWPGDLGGAHRRRVRRHRREQPPGLQRSAADFDTREPYIVVSLDDACRRQQFGEGWFPTLADVPSRAISMSVHQILEAHQILCIVPDMRKAEAVRASVEGPSPTRCPPPSCRRTRPCRSSSTRRPPRC